MFLKVYPACIMVLKNEGPSSVYAPRSLVVLELTGPEKSFHDLAHVQAGAQAEKEHVRILISLLCSTAYTCFLSLRATVHLNLS